MKIAVPFAVLTALIAFGAGSARAQMDGPIVGYRDSNWAAEHLLEKRVQTYILPSRLDTLVRMLSSESRIAGSPADERTVQRVEKLMRDAGLEVKTYPYTVYLPYATKVSLEMTAPKHRTFTLHEKLLPEEHLSESQEYPWANGYTGAGEVEAQIVYVNFGLPDDYHILDSLGISVRGKIVLARYGKSYRGIKARLAEDHGAAAILIFTDPSGDGYSAGDVYPAGPMRPMDGIQRGSIYNGHGDPTTPNFPSTQNSTHLLIDSSQRLPKIPSMPISAEIAEDLLSELTSGELPNQSWEGGFALRYHTGPGSVKVKMNVETDRTFRTIWNTTAKVIGAVFPDEWVIVGGHRDAWGPGAEDNGSGAAAVLATAEAVARLAKEGIRPARSILFATWDAEEWGLLGSTEWTEELTRELNFRATAYINEDECATGPTFSADADPALRPFLWQVTQSVASPDGMTVYDRWKSREMSTMSEKAFSGEMEPSVGLLGGGSDFSSFYGHLGIPSINQGFSGRFGQYHSMHDNYFYVKHFGDTSFDYHATIAKLDAVEALRLANADILPYDFAEFSSAMKEFVHQIERDAPQAWLGEAGLSNLDTALAQMGDAAAKLNEVRIKALHVRPMTIDEEHTTNARVRKIAFQFVEAGGLTTDEWVHNLVVCTDPDNGYADITLPELRLAIRSQDKARFVKAAQDLLLRTRITISELTNITDRIRTGGAESLRDGTR